MAIRVAGKEWLGAAQHLRSGTGFCLAGFDNAHAGRRRTPQAAVGHHKRPHGNTRLGI